MKKEIVILANKQSADYINKKVSFILKDRKNEMKVTHIINNESDFKEYIKDIEDNKYSPKNLRSIFFFITPELFWESQSLDEGYAYALKLIGAFKGRYVSQFRFLSLAPYSLIKENCLSQHFGLVLAFPYYDLADDAIWDSILDEYSDIHYKFIIHTVYSEQGYIDWLIHDANNLILTNNPNEYNDKEFIERLKGLSIKSDKIQFDKYNFYDRKDFLNVVLLVLIDLKNNKINGNISKLSVLIIEDNTNDHSFLHKLLKVNFESVNSILVSDNIAPIPDDKTLNPIDMLYKKILSNNKQYDIIFLDIQYTNPDGNWLTFNGLDIYKALQENDRYCVPVIVSGLPRTSLSSLVQEHINTAGIPYHRILSKAYGKDVLKIDLAYKIPRIIKDGERYSSLRRRTKVALVNAKIPKNGIFRNENLRIDLLTRMYDDTIRPGRTISYKDEFDNMVADIGSTEKVQNISSKTTFNIDKLWDRLGDILKLRFQYLRENKKSYFDSLQSYLNTLGFNTKKTNNHVSILVSNLFEHEENIFHQPAVINNDNLIGKKERIWIKEACDIIVIRNAQDVLDRTLILDFDNIDAEINALTYNVLIERLNIFFDRMNEIKANDTPLYNVFSDLADPIVDETSNLDGFYESIRNIISDKLLVVFPAIDNKINS